MENASAKNWSNRSEVEIHLTRIAPGKRRSWGTPVYCCIYYACKYYQAFNPERRVLLQNSLRINCMEFVGKTIRRDQNECLTFHRGKQAFILLNILIDSISQMLVWNDFKIKNYLTLKLKFLEHYWMFKYGTRLI